MLFGTVENHREREKGVLVYPVYSRRAGGLSVGINLYPGKKSCTFACPYCEVFPFATNAEFSVEQMEQDLRSVIANALEQNIPVKDICFSGNGEPSLSPHFPEALKMAVRIRSELVPAAELVLISNGTGLFQPEIFSLLKDSACGSLALNIWLKLDAGTPSWYKKINRTAIPHKKLIAVIKEFAACTPFTIQTMLCAIDGEEPPSDEAQEWENLVTKLVVIASEKGQGIRKIQMYGKARPSPEDPKAQSLSISYLEERAALLHKALNSSPLTSHFSLLPMIEVYP